MASTEKAQEILDDLHAGIEAMVSDADWKRALDVATRFHRYSFNNLMLIVMQDPDATQVAGFNTWKSMGRFVRKGERGIRILAPMVRKVTVEDDQGNEETRRVVKGFRVVSVFDVAQTDGDDLPELPAPVLLDDDQVPDGAQDAVVAQIRAAGFTFEVAKCPMAGANGCTEWDRKRVTVDPDLSPARTFKTSVHELAHILLHADAPRLEFSCRGRYEVEAESVAYVVAGSLGMPTADYSFPYIATWAKGDTKLVESTGAAVVKTAASIVDQIAPESAAQEEVAA